MKHKLVENWKDAWKWFSVQAMAAAAGILALWPMLPEEWRASVPDGVVTGITIFVLIAGGLGRIVKQGGGK